MPYPALTADNNVRADSSLEKLAKLKPSFAKDGTLTAGNSTPLTDGAAAGAARLRGLGALARPADPGLPQLRQGRRGGLRRRRGTPDGARRSPCPRMLADAGLTLQDFDFYEIHEAFAAQVLSHA